MHCPDGDATDPIWRVLASSQGISCWTPLKPQHSNPNPNPLANQLWSIDFLTPPTPHIIPHRLSAFLESLMPLKNWCSIHARWSKSSLKHSIHFCGIFKCPYKKVWKLIEGTTYISLYICVCVYIYIYILIYIHRQKTMVVKHLKYWESNTQSWNKHFWNNTWPWFLILFSLNIFVISIVSLFAQS